MSLMIRNSDHSDIKITPVRAHRCIECGKCNNACPMGLDVMKSAAKGKRINENTRILCERCVDACPMKCLRMLPGIPIQKMRS